MISKHIDTLADSSHHFVIDPSGTTIMKARMNGVGGVWCVGGCVVDGRKVRVVCGRRVGGCVVDGRKVHVVCGRRVGGCVSR